MVMSMMVGKVVGGDLVIKESLVSRYIMPLRHSSFASTLLCVATRGVSWGCRPTVLGVIGSVTYLCLLVWPDSFGGHRFSYIPVPAGVAALFWGS